jgi:hypothetical protein
VLGCQSVENEVMIRVGYGFEQVYYLYEPLAYGPLLQHYYFPQIFVANFYLA